jgi:transcription initiation factor TFIIF subunit alpha
MRAVNTGPSAPSAAVKVERFDDDYKREGRTLERGLEGGADEELDFDANEHFQDDDDVNTFYRNEDEEEEAKLQEVGLMSYLREIKLMDRNRNV